MTDPIVPGGAGLPDQQSSPADASQPQAEPAEAPQPAAPADSGAGFGMPAGFGAPPPADAGAATPPEWGAPATPASPPPADTWGAPSAPPPGGAPAGGWTAGTPLKPGERPARGEPRSHVHHRRRDPRDHRRGRRDQRARAEPPSVTSRSVIASTSRRACGEADTVDTVQHHPCNQSHTGRGDLRRRLHRRDRILSGHERLRDVRRQHAADPAFQTYVGTSLDADPDLSIGYFYPLADGWSNGERERHLLRKRTDDSADELLGQGHRIRGSGGLVDSIDGSRLGLADEGHPVALGGVEAHPQGGGLLFGDLPDVGRLLVRLHRPAAHDRA